MPVWLMLLRLMEFVGIGFHDIYSSDDYKSSDEEENPPSSDDSKSSDE